MRVIVTGGAGFIGSHVADALCAAGHHVYVLDDLSTGRRENVPDGAVFVEGDVRDEALVEDMFRDVRPDAVVHQAAQTSVTVSVREPRRDADVNIGGTVVLLEAARRHGVARFVFASTGGAIYGEVPEGTRAEIGWPERPESPYGIGKLAAEHYVRAATGPIPHTAILRYANVYGPRQDPHGEAGVVAIFTERLLDGVPVTVYGMAEAGDGGCVRDYVFVGDVVDANLAALAGRLAAPVVHVATGVGTRTSDLLAALERHFGPASQVVHAPPRPGDLGRSVLAPCPDLAAPTPLDEGLAATVAWFRARRER